MQNNQCKWVTWKAIVRFGNTPQVVQYRDKLLFLKKKKEISFLVRFENVQSRCLKILANIQNFKISCFEIANVFF